MARDGNILVSPFQCDTYWFRNLTLRDPRENSVSNNRLLVFIRRANLDMLRGTSTSTVASTKSNVGKGVLMCKELGIAPTYPELVPYPIGDSMGFTVALQMLKASFLPGKYHNTYQQFDTICNSRTAYSNLY